MRGGLLHHVERNRDGNGRVDTQRRPDAVSEKPGNRRQDAGGVRSQTDGAQGKASRMVGTTHHCFEAVLIRPSFSSSLRISDSIKVLIDLISRMAINSLAGCRSSRESRSSKCHLTDSDLNFCMKSPCFPFLFPLCLAEGCIHGDVSADKKLAFPSARLLD